MSSLDGLYQEVILDHSKRPVGKGEFIAPDGTLTASHHEFNPSCGDEITLSIAVQAGGDVSGDEGGDAGGDKAGDAGGDKAGDPETAKIEVIAWEGQGCSISMASASILSQLVREESLTIAEAHERIGAFREMIQTRGSIEPDEELLGDAVVLQGVSKFVMRVKCAMLAWVALEADLRQIEASQR